MRHSVSLRSAILLAATLVLLAACGGSASPSPTIGQASPVSSSLAPASVEPAPSAPTPSEPASSPSAAASAPAASPAAGIPPFSVASLEAAEPGLDSYRADFLIGGALRYQSVIVAKPSLAKFIKALNPDGTIKTRVVVIGKQVWTASGSAGLYSSMSPTRAAALVAAFDPGLLLRSFLGLDWATLAANQGTETKNGVPARHLRLDSASAVGLAKTMPAGSAIDVWVTPTGDVVAWEMSGFPKDKEISIEVSGFNDPANVVSAPNP